MFNYACIYIYIYISMQISHTGIYMLVRSIYGQKTREDFLSELSIQRIGDGSERPREPQSWLRRFLVSKYWGTLWFLRFQQMNWKDPPFSSWVDPLFLW